MVDWVSSAERFDVTACSRFDQIDEPTTWSGLYWIDPDFLYLIV
jgi:hypothetical protein